jgi:hypothetical protein
MMTGEGAGRRNLGNAMLSQASSIKISTTVWSSCIASTSERGRGGRHSSRSPRYFLAPDRSLNNPKPLHNFAITRKAGSEVADEARTLAGL